MDKKQEAPACMRGAAIATDELVVGPAISATQAFCGEMKKEKSCHKGGEVVD
jgi:hypothetical protein